MWRRMFACGSATSGGIARGPRYFIVLWAILSGVVIATVSSTEVPSHVFLLFGSILSIIGSLLILISGATASLAHRQKYQFVYALTVCALVLALKMFITAVMVSAGYDLHWQAQHTATRYILALSEHFAMMGDLGYCFIILVEVLMTINEAAHPFPDTCTLHKIYHVAVWLIAIITCIPPVAAGAIGVGDHGTVYFMGAYDGYLLYFQAAFALFSMIACIVPFLRVHEEQIKDKKLAEQQLRCKPRNAVNEVPGLNHHPNKMQMSLMTFLAFVLSTGWNFAYHISVFSTNIAPHWLNAVQLFWLGGVGFLSAIVWYPFIKYSLIQVGYGIGSKFPTQPKPQRAIVRRVYIDTKITSSISSERAQSLPVYRIPDRWQNETLCPEEDYLP